MPNVLANIARMTSATTGTGTLTLGSAVTGCLSFADSGITNGQVVTYCIEDYSEAGAVTGREVGVGTYTASGTTLSRTTVYNSTAGGTTKLNCSGRQHVFITVAKQDMDARQPQENGFENRTDSSISFNNGNRTLTITPTGTSFSYFTGNAKYTKSGAEGVAITDTEGLHYVYYDGPTLSVTTTFTPSMITTYAFVAAIYWDADNNLGLIVADERHGSTMDSQTHLYNHLTFGARYGNGLALSSILVDQNGSSATHAQFGVSSGEIWDEDIQFAITAGSPQTLAAPAQIPVFYRSGASGVWRKVNATTYPLTTTGTGRMAWNQFTGGSWALAEITNGQYGLMHYLATTNILEPIIAIVGQAQYSTLTAAQTAAKTEMLNLSTGALATLSAEFVPIATLIFETQNSYSNAVKTRIRSTDTGASYIDWRSSRNFATSGISSNAAMFSTVSVSGQSDVVADTVSDTLTLAAGSNITITTNASTDTITIASNVDAQSFDDAATTVAAATINASVNHIRTAGYYAVGDGGGALYKRSSGSPTGAGTKYITSNGGSVVWELAAEPVMNVQQFGAYNDGTNAATTTAAFQAAAAFSKTVYVPRGTFAINGTVTISLNGSYWYGAGQDNSTITSSSTSAPMFSINGSLQGVTIKDLFLTRSVTSTSGAYGINCGGVTIGKATFESLRIKNQFIGMYLGATDWSKVSDVTVENSYAIGFYIKALAGDATCQWYFQNCLSQFNNNQGYLWESTAGVAQMLVGTMENCATYANTGAGLAYAGNATTPIQGARILGGFFGDSGYSEIYLDTYGNQHMISDCFVELAGTGATGRTFNTPKSDQGHGIEITPNNTAVLISDCHINGCSWDGIKSSATETTISNVRAMNNGAAALSGERNGIYIQAGTSTISGGRIGNTGAGASQLYGIRGTNGSNVTVTSVDLTNNATAPVYWDSNGTSASVLMCLPSSANSVKPTNVSFTQTGTSASVRTVDAKLKDAWVSVTDFGADPTGSADATSAINAAITAVNAAGGGVVYFPPGVYTTSTGITLGNGSNSAMSTKDNRIRLVGAGYGAASSISNQQNTAVSRIKYTGTTSSTASVVQFAGPIHTVGIENLTLDADGKAGYGLLLYHVGHSTFHRVSVLNYTNVGYYLTTRDKYPTGAAFGCADNRFTDCYGYLDNFPTVDIRGIVLHSGVVNESVTFSSSNTFLLATYTSDIENAAMVTFSSSGTLPTGITAGTAYYTIRVNATTSYLATSRANALTGSPISHTNNGTGSHTITKNMQDQPDSCRNVFVGGTYFYNNTQDSHGVWLGAADNNTFIETQFMPCSVRETVTFSNSGGHLLMTYTTDMADYTEVRFETTAYRPAGLASETSYWIKRQNATTAKIATSRANAIAGTFISYTDAGTGTQYYLTRAQGYDVYLQQWPDSTGLFPNENFFSNLGMSRGVGGNGNVGSNGGNLFVPFPTSDGGGGLETVTGISGITHDGKQYISGQRAWRSRQVVMASSTTDRSTSNSSFQDITDYSVTLTTKADSKLKITFAGAAAKWTGGFGYFCINVDSSDYLAPQAIVHNDSNYSGVNCVYLLSVGAGSHTVKGRFRSDGTGEIHLNNGTLIVEELY